MRGQISQGICFPISILPADTYEEDQDVTARLGIEKYEKYEDIKVQQYSKVVYPKWMPKMLIKLVKKTFFNLLFKKKYHDKTFPSVIPKTDETRVQVLQALLSKHKGTKCYVTEKLDGSSITIYQINKKFGVCSRKVDLRKDEDNNFWKVALQYNLDSKFRVVFGNMNVAIQGEMIGNSIQGNKYKLNDIDMYIFNLYFIDEKRYADLEEFKIICEALGVKRVPLLTEEYILEDDIKKLVEMSKGKSVLLDIQGKVLL